MFGLFNKTISNEELLVMIVRILTAIRAAYRTNDSLFESEVKTLLRWVELRCNEEKKKVTSAQRDYVVAVSSACELNNNEIRRITDELLTAIDTPNPTQASIDRRQALRDELEGIFKSYIAGSQRLS